MARPIIWPPKIRSTRGRDYARFTLDGQRREVALGPTGSAESRAAYLRLLAEIEASGRHAPLSPVALDCAGLVCAYLEQHVAGRYGKPQRWRITRALEPVVRLYGTVPAADFGPLALRACRAELVAAGYARSYVNAMTDCIRACWRWAVAGQLVGVQVLAALLTVPAIRAADPGAPADRPEVGPVDPAEVLATLPFLQPCLADMLRLQLVTGMRPGEVCLLRPCDVEPWQEVDGVAFHLYRLDRHKNQWRGLLRWIPLPPQAMDVLRPYLLGRSPEAYCFSPRETAERFLREAGRTINRDRARAPGERYLTTAYDRAVRKGILRRRKTLAASENPAERELAGAISLWTPNQIRHTVATEIESAQGREASQAALGHESPDTTAIYARQTEKAARALLRRLQGPDTTGH